MTTRLQRLIRAAETLQRRLLSRLAWSTDQERRQDLAVDLDRAEIVLHQMRVEASGDE